MMLVALKLNWKVYLMEAVCLGIFMISASVFATLLEYPDSPLHRALPSEGLRLALMGLAMGLTATGIIYSPMGKLSGAHMNPAITVVFYRLGKIKLADGLYYIIFQIAGGVLAVYLMHLLIGRPFEDAHVNYVVTAPGKYGTAGALVTELLIAFGMMMMVLSLSNHPRYAKFTGVVSGFFVMSYVILSAPISGFGMNPARTLASAIPAMQYNSLWLYILAPIAGMWLAASLYHGNHGIVRCAKFHHSHFYRCIFNCGYCQHENELQGKE